MSQPSARNGKTKCSGMLGGSDEEKNKEGTAQGQAVPGWEGPRLPQEMAELRENGNPWLW